MNDTFLKKASEVFIKERRSPLEVVMSRVRFSATSAWHPSGSRFLFLLASLTLNIDPQYCPSPPRSSLK